MRYTSGTSALWLSCRRTAATTWRQASHCFYMPSCCRYGEVGREVMGWEVMVIFYLLLMGDWGGGKEFLLFPAHFL